jgi:hypothetical protein
MSATTDPFADLIRTHEAVTEAVTAAMTETTRTWADAVTACVAGVGRSGSELPDPRTLVDSAFDVAEQALGQQRRWVHTLVGAVLGEQPSAG